MLRIYSREGVVPRVSGFFLNAVVQAVLIFRMDNWVVNPRMGKALGRVSGPGGKTADRMAPAEDSEQEVEIHLSSDGTGGGGGIGGG